MRISAIMGLAALSLATTPFYGDIAMAAIPAPASTHPTVAIGASAMEEAAPDMATISAGLETREPTAQAAMEKNNRDFARIQALVRKYKIEPKDVQTESITVREDYEYNDAGRQSRGFVASNALTVTMRDLNAVGAFMADLVAAGANNVSGPSFGLDDSEFLTDKAREKAFDTAQRRALAYARKAGFKSVRLLTINEGAGEMAYAYGADAAAAGAAAAAEGAAAAMKMDMPAAPVEPGLVSETVYASFVFEMVP